MLESFFPKQHSSRVINSWELKKVLAQEHFKRPALRMMQPNLEEDRTRLDIMLLNGKLGIRGPTLSEGDFEFVPFQNPDCAHPEISKMMHVLEASHPLPEIAQLRFRYSETFESRGLWVDCSNEMIEECVNEALWLQKLLKNGWNVELGHQAKEVYLDGNSIVFREATPRPWLPSYDIQNCEINLSSYISSFSQPGPEANRCMLAAAFEICEEHRIRPSSIAEWGAGYGNLSAAFSTLYPSSSLWASDSDPRSAHCLKLNAETFFPRAICTQERALKWSRTDELLVIDPPRSGFPELLESLTDCSAPPQWVLAFHCHQRGLSNDLSLLRKAQYELLDWSCVDIFPATPYMEHISLWKHRNLS